MTKLVTVRRVFFALATTLVFSAFVNRISSRSDRTTATVLRFLALSLDFRTTFFFTFDFLFRGLAFDGNSKHPSSPTTYPGFTGLGLAARRARERMESGLILSGFASFRGSVTSMAGVLYG